MFEMHFDLINIIKVQILIGITDLRLVILDI